MLEAHVLTALCESGTSFVSPSTFVGANQALVEHLICIGDPEQLRPNVSNFGWCFSLRRMSTITEEL